MQLIQINSSPAKPLTIREMFEQMAQREAEMVRAARRGSSLVASATRDASQYSWPWHRALP